MLCIVHFWDITDRHDILQPGSLSVNRSTIAEPGLLLSQVNAHSDQVGEKGL